MDAWDARETNTTDSDEAVRTENLTRRFGKLTAVDQLNFSVRKGEIFGLVGPDGAGKTTTLRLLCGLMQPTSGSIRVARCEVGRDNAELKNRIGYMPQQFGLYRDLTVQENLDFYADLFGLAEEKRSALITRLLQMTRMQPFCDRQARQLSGGMKQKLGLMCALLHEPEILFLDEPTTGVDPISRRDFWVILYQLVRRGMTVVVTTAYLDEAERCHRVGLLYQGQMIVNEAPDVLGSKLEETCFELSTSDNRKAQRLLESWDDVLSVETSGPVLRLFALSKPDFIARVQQELSRGGLSPGPLKPITPALEDVFIALVRKRSKVNHG